MNFSLAAAPTAVDLDQDGLIDRVYIGDVGGQLWKFDVSPGATWTGKRLFAADPSQPNPPPIGEYYPDQAIYASPTLTFDNNNDLWVFFGTGDKDHPISTSANRFYGLKDDTNMTNGSALTESSLVDVTSVDATAVQGWFLRLESDEKVLAAADVFYHMVLFSTFTPSTTATCDEAGNGTAKLYAVQLSTGYAALDFSTGLRLSTTDSSAARSKTVGTGIPSKPTMLIDYLGSTATTSITVATSNQELSSNPAPPLSLRRIRSWREAL